MRFLLYCGDRGCTRRVQQAKHHKRISVKPCKARTQAGLSAEEVANTLGLPVPGYKKREDGRVRITLEQCRTLSKMFGLSMTEFNDVFFRSGLPFGKEDLASFTSIIPQKAREINVEASNGCRV